LNFFLLFKFDLLSCFTDYLIMLFDVFPMF